MLKLMQGIILLEGLVYIFRSVSALENILLRARQHVVYVAWTQVMVVYELVYHFSITLFLGWIQIRPRKRSLEYCDHLFPNQRSICNERVGEWSDKIPIVLTTIYSNNIEVT